MFKIPIRQIHGFFRDALCIDGSEASDCPTGSQFWYRALQKDADSDGISKCGVSHAQGRHVAEPQTKTWHTSGLDNKLRTSDKYLVSEENIL